jgi:glutathione S-transferase
VPYADRAREKDGVKAMMRIIREHHPAPFAPPFLKMGEHVIAQTAAILHFLGPRLGLVPEDEPSRILALQLQLTIADLGTEVHDTHHPLGSHLYYEDQRTEALARSGGFVRERIPKFLGYFERMLGDRGHLVGDAASYVDLSMFQVLKGLEYAFPKAMTRMAPKIPGLTALAARVAKRPRIAAYLASERRIALNEDDLFRAYPELDIDPEA